MIKGNLLGIVLAAFVLTGTVYAADAPAAAPTTTPPAPQTETVKPVKHKGISNAAIEACTAKAEGAECSYTTAKGKKMSGTCGKNKKGDVFFCKRAKKTEK